MFNVNADLFRATALFVSTEETRYYLNGVHISAHGDSGVLLVATDGHRAFVAHDESGTCDAGDNYIVKLDAASLKAAKRGKGETGPRRIIGGDVKAPAWIATCEHDKGEPQLEACSNVHMVNAWNIDGTFPDWRRVMPSQLADNAAPLPPQWYNADYVATFGDAARIIRDLREGGFVHLEPGAIGGPALVRMSGIENAFGVLMPGRGVGAGYPAFMSARPAPIKQAA